MIVLISKKDFLKNSKGLLKGSNYGIIDGVGENDKDLDEFGAIRNADERFDVMNAPKAITSKSEIDMFRVRKKIDNYLEKLPRAFACTAALQITTDDGDIDPDEKLKKNVYVILTNKTYKALAKKIQSRFIKVLGLKEDDGDVVVLFTKYPSVLASEDFKEAAEKELKKIDKKIDSLVDDIESGYDIWDESDVGKSEKKLEKLRKERKKIAKAIEGDSKEMSDHVRTDLLMKNAAISKSARKKLAKYCISYHKHNGSEYFLSHTT